VQKSLQERIQTGECFKQKDCANNLYQRKYYETPLYGHVRATNRKGDKGRSMRKRRSPRVLFHQRLRFMCFAGLWIRIRDPDWIRIQSGLWIQIRIRNPDPDPGGQK
jgi:hypothetical protein